MGVQHFETQEDMDDAFEEIMEREEAKTRLRHEIEEMENEIESLKDELREKEEELKELEEEN